ncbi:MAG: hypothetical protein FKY71_16630 [Spiribacter salinus]|uniref:Uncharacterized protein n=1 Tax=Spiribacter salinus TaxID=1335746 RepID=A0A540VI85_9GAMM|nr:MAG: hypothetical protein FKY71_16630 [Spiribacter salinus]
MADQSNQKNQVVPSLSKAAIQELTGSKEKLTEFTTVGLIQAITTGLTRIRQSNTSPTAVINYIEALRKVRADLTGDDHENNVPQMMVNIQFNNQNKATPSDVTIEAKKSEPPKKPLSEQDSELLEQVDDMLDGGAWD